MGGRTAAAQLQIQDGAPLRVGPDRAERSRRSALAPLGGGWHTLPWHTNTGVVFSAMPGEAGCQPRWLAPHRLPGCRPKALVIFIDPEHARVHRLRPGGSCLRVGRFAAHQTGNSRPTSSRQQGHRPLWAIALAVSDLPVPWAPHQQHSLGRGKAHSARLRR